MKKLFRYYLPYLKEYKLQFFFAIIGMVMIAVGTAGTAQLIKPVLDEIFINKDEEMLKIMPFAIFGVFFLKGLGRYIQTYYTTYIGQDVIRRLRDNLVGHLLHQDIDFFKKKHSGELLSRVTNDIARVQNVVSNMIPEFAREILTIIALVGYVIYLSPKLSFYFLVIMPLAVIPLSKLAKKMKKYSKLSQESTSDLTSRLNEIFQNIEVIKSNSTQPYELERFEKENRRVFKYAIKQIKTNALTSPVMELLGSIAIGLVIYIGGKEVIDGHMTVGSFFAFSAALFMLYDPIRRLSGLYNKMQDAVAATERMFELLSIKPTVKEGDKDLPEKIENIRFENVKLSYEDKEVLKGISFEANRGESVAFVGDSGAGKSSIVSLLVRFYAPDSGKILINGIPIDEFRLKSLHKKIAYVTQNIYIFNDTIAQNVAYGEDVDEEKVIEALKKAYAWEFVKELPEGIHTLLSEGGANLSGGQKQRIALARAFYKDPEILILDEATSALDNRSERFIKEAIFEFSKEKITFIVAHRLSTIEDADKIIVLKEGQKVCEGKHKELLEKCDVYQNLQKTIH
ncbi:ABC transporter ATP-binding protein [Nitrosophilus alvini]|uniref:ABC transporter ATP-binding protein n=1 Tax=Nitrosophilus alvini TaxID=2714855 RepID=UPI00190A9AA4|nr:ABC transporter ATP-binding protein [Nitrosophilus alvini]